MRKEHIVIISGARVAPTFLLASGSMRDSLVCEAYARTIIGSYSSGQL